MKRLIGNKLTYILWLLKLFGTTEKQVSSSYSFKHCLSWTFCSKEEEDMHRDSSQTWPPGGGTKSPFGSDLQSPSLLSLVYL